MQYSDIPRVYLGGYTACSFRRSFTMRKMSAGIRFTYAWKRWGGRGDYDRLVSISTNDSI